MAPRGTRYPGARVRSEIIVQGRFREALFHATKHTKSPPHNYYVRMLVEGLGSKARHTYRECSSVILRNGTNIFQSTSCTVYKQAFVSE